VPIGISLFLLLTLQLSLNDCAQLRFTCNSIECRLSSHCGHSALAADCSSMLEPCVSRVRRALAGVLLAATMALASQAAVARDGLAGRYRLHDGPDVASELLLRPNGKFEYFLMAGSLDEQARGSWRVNGGVLRLTTLPKPVAAVFSTGPASSTADGPLVLHVTTPDGHGIASVHFALGFDAGQPMTGYTQDYGWSLDGTEKRTPRWIVFSVPIYNLRSPRFPIDLAKGNELTFILTPNGLGTFDFTGMRIDIQPRRLILHRDGGLMIFEAIGSGR
jgi:hypothetical protein